MKQFTKVFKRLETLIGGAKFSIRVDCDNLEVVHLQRNADGNFIVTDRNYAVSYLSNNSKTYKTPEEYGLQSIQTVCDKHEVEFVDTGEDEKDFAPCMTILRLATTDREILDAISAVAACLDEIFDSALKG